MKKSKGISLIVLLITLLVVIILAAVVVLTLSKNNPIESAKEARFKEDVRTFQDELAMTVSKQYAMVGGHRDEKISTTDFDEIKEYIPSFNEKYRGKFIIYNDELSYTDKLDDKEKIYAQSLNVNKKSLLPDEYRKVEYIESTGTQYIDTKYMINENFKYEIKCAITDTRTSDQIWPVLIGAYGKSNGSDGKCYKIGYYPSSKNLSFVSFNVKYNLNDIYKVEYNLEKLVVNGEEQSNTRVWNGAPCNTVYLFCAYTSEVGVTRDFFAKARIYYAKIYDGDNIVRDLIPCYRKSDGKIGVYDLVENKFYEMSGTGTPLKGKEI